MAASTSTAADSNYNAPYDVFISHRGPDVKTTFASHLYRRLISYGLRVFLDYKELQEGEQFPFQIKRAIRAASLHVAIFSPRYADSEWCMEELVLMLESRAPIIPVFHHVKPTELRRTHGQGGVYATSLRNLENKTNPDSQPRYDSKTIESWRNALSQVADISGLDLEAFNGDEGELVDKIVEVVLKKVVKTSLDLPKYPTGLKEKVQDFERKVLLQQGSGRVQVVGITGLGGVGKTTLAIELFNRKSSNYRNSHFLSEVREKAKISLSSLQSRLLKGLRQLELHISEYEGNGTLKRHLTSCQVLIVLDDVDHEDQVDALLPLDVLHHDSLVLITSRDKGVLKRSGVPESSIYQLNGLNRERSKELFCSHAFGQPHPSTPEFSHLVDNFLTVCNGLPLSLRVIGRLLSGKTDEFYWKNKLEELKKTLPDEIRKSLQISYDALEEEEQQIFLDIACFFIEKERDTAISVWDGSGWNGKLGFESLLNKCLVEVYIWEDKSSDAFGRRTQHRIRMHDHLRVMGRDLANSSRFPCRLWCGHNIEGLSQQSFEATEVRGIGIHRPAKGLTTALPELTTYKMKNLQILDIGINYGFKGVKSDSIKCLLEGLESPNLLWLRWSNCQAWPCLAHIPMKELRVLDVEGHFKRLWEENMAPLQLRELLITPHWLDFEIPKSIGQLKHLERIVVISTLDVKFPKEFWYLRSLKNLVFHIRRLSSLPDSFGNLATLESIDLSDCRDLKRLPDSFGNLSMLKYIKLNLCPALESLPDSFGNLSMLEHIVLDSCKVLESLPDSFGNLSTLKYIKLYRCHGLKRLPDSFGNLSMLEHIVLDFCNGMKSLPDSFLLLNQLIHLTVVDCSPELHFKAVEGENEKSRDSGGERTSSNLERCLLRLQHLTLRNTQISEVSFPTCVCPNLQYLDIINCPDLVEVTLPNALRSLILDNCSKLRKIGAPFPTDACSNLQDLHIMKCKDLVEVTLPNAPKELSFYNASSEDLAWVMTLQHGLASQHGLVMKVEISNFSKLRKIGGSFPTGVCPKFQDLNIQRCENLVELEILPTALQHLKIRKCEKLVEVDCPNLQPLEIWDRQEQGEVPTLPNGHIKLQLIDCPRLRKIEQLCGSTKLPTLDVSGSEEVEVV